MLYEHTNIGRLILEHICAQEKMASVQKPYDANEARRVSAGLDKIASFPYNEEVYGSVQSIIKMASDCIKGLCSAIESDKQKLAMLEKTAEVRALIDDMVNYGLVDDSNVMQKVAELIEETPQRLEIIKEAVKMTAGRVSENGNVFFEKQAEDAPKNSSAKKGMFDGVFGDN
jgi:hypothetical protein